VLPNKYYIESDINMMYWVHHTQYDTPLIIPISTHNVMPR